jgi:hypothetical protein
VSDRRILPLFQIVLWRTRPGAGNLTGNSLDPARRQSNVTFTVWRYHKTVPSNDHPNVTRDQIVQSAAAAAFDRPLITNVYRSLVVEAIVDAALRPDWSWCSADYAGWDFEHEDGARLEVKQSAARQSWTAPSAGSRPASFDIAERTGFWRSGSEWVPGAGRHANIYVFAHHPITDDSADHRDPRQWRFYVAPASSLPSAKSIGLPRVATLANSCGFDGLAVAAARAKDQR